MPGTGIDTLMDIWAAINSDGTDPPFANHEDLYTTIDSTAMGRIPWQSFSATYNGILPDNPPPWMVAKYDVWFRNPQEIIRDMIANPDFRDEVDYSAKRVFNAKGQREWKDFMSGNWAWKQSVCHVAFCLSKRLKR